jgi:hypothetical protein
MNCIPGEIVAMSARILAQKPMVLPKSPMTAAINYAASQ